MIAGLLAFVLAKLIADPQWLQNPQEYWFYSLILLVKVSFLKLLKLLIAPLIFFSLIGGILNIGDITRLRSLGKIAILYYLSTTVIAISLGLFAVFFIHPWTSGKTISVESFQSSESYINVSSEKFIEQGSDSIFLVFEKLLSKALVNPFEALSQTNILGIVFTAILTALAMLFVLKKESALAQMVNEFNSVLHKMLSWIIKLLPIGIFAIVFDLSLKVSSDIFNQLLSFCLLVFIMTMIHGLIVLPSIAYFFAGISPIILLKKIAKPLIVAFSTSSSSATLPVTMETCEKELGVSQSVSGFIFPLGATMNMDGTALFEGIAAVFLAHLFGVELNSISVFAIFFMAMISSVGAPGMPSGSMSGMQMVLLAAGIPLEAIGILLIVERPLDTFRTAVNVEGDIVGACVVQSYLNKEQLT